MIPEVAFAGALAQSLKMGIKIVSGRDNILAFHSILIELSERSGQCGPMEFLDFYMSSESSRKKTPHLVLVGPEVDRPGASSSSVFGALLVYEYRLLDRNTGVYATDDMTGRRTVIAPAAVRPIVAALGAEALMRQGARTVLITTQEDEGGEVKQYLRTHFSAKQRIPGKWLYTAVNRRMCGPLAIEENFDLTMAKLGKHTRRNLRYYRRRAETELGSTFVPEVSVSETEYLAFNTISTHPVSDEQAAARYEMFQGDGGFSVMGVISDNGEWLSMTGYRRYRDTIEVDWILNRGGLPNSSISTVMMAYLIEAEIERGTTRIFFEGGTTHPMRKSFDVIAANDITLVRRTPGAYLMRKLAPLLLPKKNFLAQILGNKGLTWQRWS